MNLPLIVILGPTASGKTAYSIQLAKLVNGEIVSADSRAIYCNMDIGTAKPTKQEMDGVPHWGFDLVAPNTKFTLYDFQQYAYRKIAEIRERGHVPMLVGGSGLYIDAVIYHYQLNTKNIIHPDRQQLEQWSLDELKSYSLRHGIELPRDTDNKRRLIRAIEQGGINRRQNGLDGDTIIIGIKTDKAVLRRRITERAYLMMTGGLINETKVLMEKYGDQEPFRHNLYGVTKRYLAGELTDEQYLSSMTVTDWHLAKKQLTWWRNPSRAGDIWWQTLPELRAKLNSWQQQPAGEILANLASEYNFFLSSVKNVVK